MKHNGTMVDLCWLVEVLRRNTQSRSGLPVMTTAAGFSDCNNSTRTVTPLAVMVTGSEPFIILANTIS